MFGGSDGTGRALGDASPKRCDLSLLARRLRQTENSVETISGPQVHGQEKLEICSLACAGDRSIKVCREHEIAETLYWSWRHKLIVGGPEQLAGKDRAPRRARAEVAPPRVRADARSQEL